AVAAGADTAATAAGCGRIDTLSMRDSPRSPFPPKQSRRQACGSSPLSKNTAGIKPEPDQREPLGGRNTLFLLKFFSEFKVGNPTQGLRICKMARKTGAMSLHFAALRLLKRNDLAASHCGFSSSVSRSSACLAGGPVLMGGALCRQLPPRLKQPIASTIGSVGM